MVSRIISGVLAVGYLTTALFAGGGEAVFKVAVFLLLPLACIWYSEAMGDYTGPSGRGAITRATPGCVVAFGGWVLLLLPIGLAIYALATGQE